MEMTNEQKQQFIQAQIQSTFEFLEIEIRDLIVDTEPIEELWNWSATRKSGQIVVGQVQDFQAETSYTAHPGGLRIQIAGSVAIGLHPMAPAIIEFLNCFRSEYLREPGRNSMTEIMIRSILNSMIADGTTKPNALNKLVELLHVKQNVSEKYAALQRKRH